MALYLPHLLRLLVLQSPAGLQEQMVPVIQGGLAVQALLFQLGLQAGGFAAVGNRDKHPLLFPVGQEHGGAVALPGLDGVNLNLVTVPVDVDHHLGGFPDPVQGHPGVLLRMQGKQGHCVQLEQKGADHPEEVADHGVGGPGVEQVAQAVADVEGAAAMLLDQAPDLAGEGFETTSGIDGDGQNVMVIGDQGRMLAKAEIDDPPPGAGGGSHKRPDKTAVIVQVPDPPDHVVTNTQTIKDLIQ